MTEYFSHPNKPLEWHLERVAEGAQRRAIDKLAEVASLFHDLGKINPHFQAKLKGEKPGGYSHHAYLSALGWLAFCAQNRQWLQDNSIDFFKCVAITTLIARHHGNLPNLGRQGARIFAEEEVYELKKFVVTMSEKDLPLSNFLKSLESLNSHQPFTVFLDRKRYEEFFELNLYDNKPPDPLAFFLDTQMAFARLIESDKRDAAENAIFNKERFAPKFKNFRAKLDAELRRIEAESENPEANKELNSLRTTMRKQSIAHIREGLTNGERVFTLQAPTGAGKTLMLLRLAAVIMQYEETERELDGNRATDLSIIYALPFLTITEQTANICHRIMGEDEDVILRFDSKAANKRFEVLQAEVDKNPSKENLSELIHENFSATTFDHPIVTTTFVQLFETLLSNRNSVLLRLPNFARNIFLIDEIQALPPRLYTFFIAYLDEFCRRFNSYAVFSTATMPYRRLPVRDEKPRLLFTRYGEPRPEREPRELLSANFYEHKEFNRYRITPLKDEAFDLGSLKKLVRERHANSSCLIILNTIRDTQELHSALSGEDSDANEEGEFVLLNTYFTPRDRQEKIKLCNERLYKTEKIVLIATQLIEAGVDISFPVLYRDMCPLPNLIQSAGRCNRNGKPIIGEVYLFTLKRDGKPSYTMVYRNEFEWFFASNYITDITTERELFAAQRDFFSDVGEKLHFGEHHHRNTKMNMVVCIDEQLFEEIGKFKLIDEQEFGIEFRYYVPHPETESAYEELIRLDEENKQIKRDYDEIKGRQIKIATALKKVAIDIVAFRLPDNKRDSAPQWSGEVFDIRRLADAQNDYSSITGINTNGIGSRII